MSDSATALPLKEKFSFSFALLGQTMVFNFVNLYLLIFYTDVLGISAAVAGTLFLAARLWDAVNDFLMGAAVDKTRTRWGKCRPYLLYAPLPIAIMTVLLFTTPGFGPTGKLIYASVTYILWGMFYTALDIPLWTMSSRMTVNTNQRQSLISMGRMFNIIGSALPVVLVVPLKQALGRGNESRGYLLTILIFCAIALPLMLQSFRGTKERAPATQDKSPSLSESMKAIFANKPLLLLFSSGILAVFINLPVSAGIYFATYVLGDEGLFAVLAGTVLTSAIVGSAIAPYLARKYSSRGVLIVTSLMATVLFVAAWFIGTGNLVVVIVLAFVIGTLLGIPLVLRTSMLADTVEYAEMKTGKRSEGIIFSTLTFSGKLKLGVAAFLAGWVLKQTGYMPNVTQDARSLNGMLMMLTLIPALGSLLTVIPLLFYKLDEKEHQRIVGELD